MNVQTLAGDEFTSLKFENRITWQNNNSYILHGFSTGKATGYYKGLLVRSSAYDYST
jgi:hypothetical protein